MRKAVLALLTLSLVPVVTGQHRFDPVARSAGGVWLREGGDPWCTLGAPALLSSVRRMQGGLAHFPAPWGIGELSGSAAVLAIPAGPGGIGLSVTRFGFDLYAETNLGVAYGGSAGILLYGIGARYRHLRIERYGSAGVPCIDAAVVIVTGDWFRWGIRITDVNRPALGRTGERVRESVSLAVAFFPPGAPSLAFQAERDELGSFSTKAGVSYKGEILSVRFGMSGSFTRIHCGLEVTPGGLGIGYGVVVHPELGWSHSAWLVIDIAS